MALRASCNETSDGVDTTTAPVSGTVCTSDKRDVARARRQIDDEIVELSPLHETQKLPDDRVQHGPAPDDGLVAGIEKSDRDDFQPESLDRFNAVLANHARLVAHAQHQRDIGAVDVGVEQPDFVPHLDQRDGEVDRERGLADTALARTDGDDGVHARQRLRTLLRRAMLMRYLCVQRVTLQVRIAKMRKNPKLQLYRRELMNLGRCLMRRSGLRPEVCRHTSDRMCVGVNECNRQS